MYVRKIRRWKKEKIYFQIETKKLTGGTNGWVDSIKLFSTGKIFQMNVSSMRKREYCGNPIPGLQASHPASLSSFSLISISASQPPSLSASQPLSLSAYQPISHSVSQPPSLSAFQFPSLPASPNQKLDSIALLLWGTLCVRVLSIMGECYKWSVFLEKDKERKKKIDEVISK